MKKNQRTLDRYTLARSSPLVFASLILPRFETADHLKPLDSILYDSVYGDCKRAVVSMPRRHGKTTFLCEVGVLWFIGNMERQGKPVEVMICCYNQQKANDISRAIRTNLEHEAINQVFPSTKLNPENYAVEQWATMLGSKIYAVGIGGSVTGRGADLLICDDTIKDDEQARSPVYLERLVNWYQSCAYTSCYKDSTIIHIGTRWCKDDLIGHVLKNPVEPWRVITQPAIINEGKEDERALWPEHFPLERLKQIRASLFHHIWSTMFQAVPVDATGQTLGTPNRAEHPISKVFGFVDPAYDGKDYTAWCFGGITQDGNIQIIRADKQRQNAISCSQLIADTAKEVGCRTIFVESNADQGWLTRELLQKNVHAMSVKATKNKVGRIQHFVKGNYNRLFLSDRCNPEYVTDVATWSELSAHDDAIDSLAGLIEHLIDKSTSISAYSNNIFSWK